MKHRLLLLLLAALALVATRALTAPPAAACVGRTLYVGALNNDEGRVMAELLVLLINERTGTTVKIRLFDSSDQVYTALKADAEEERVDIIVENTVDGAAVLKEQTSGDADADYQKIKNAYDAQLALVWLPPFGFTNGKGEGARTVSAPLVRRDVLTNFPLLPRVLNKLAGAIDNPTYTELMKNAAAGDKPKNIAKDFLRAKKFI
ncbi:MAG: hypothetical protein AB1568_05870 [Thermodesulfobacteriota bacterium]